MYAGGLSAALSGRTFDAAHINTVVCHEFVEKLQGQVPRLWHIHEFDPEYQGVTWSRVAEVAKSVEAMAYCSRKVRKKYESMIGITNGTVVFNSKCRLQIRNKAEARASLGVPENAFVILTIGHFEPRKRHPDICLACLNLSKAERKDVWCVLVGDNRPSVTSNEVGWIRRQSESSGVNIVMPGEVEDPSEWYAAADLYVCASDNECVPLSIVEAMANGLPILTSDVGGITELVAPGHNAATFQAGHEEAISEALAKLRFDHEARASMGAASLEVYRTIEAENRPADDLLEHLWSAYMSG